MNQTKRTSMSSSYGRGVSLFMSDVFSLISPLNTGLEHLKPHNGLNFYASDRLGRPSMVNLGNSDR